MHQVYPVVICKRPYAFTNLGYFLDIALNIKKIKVGIPQVWFSLGEFLHLKLSKNRYLGGYPKKILNAYNDF